MKKEDLFRAIGAADETLLEHSEQTAQKLDDRNIAVRAGYHCSYLAHSFCKTTRSGTVRVSPSVFNTKSDVKFFVFSLNLIANNGKM